MLRQADKLPNRRSLARTWRVLVCSAAITATVVCSNDIGFAAPQPPNPSDAQLNAAAQAKATMAANVGRLSGLLVQAQAQLRNLSAQAELAEQKFALAMQRLNQAKTDAAQAQADVKAAQTRIERARTNLTSYVRNSYMSPTNGSATVGLLTAQNPDALLQRGDYQRYVSARHLDAVGELDRATVVKSNADAKAKALLQLQTRLTAEADEAQQAARAAYQAERNQAAVLQTQQATYQKQLAAAQIQLATLNGQRATFVAWQEEQARIAAEKARQAQLAREAAARAAAAALAAQQAAQQQSQNNGGNGAPAPSPLPPSGSMGSWTAAKGQAAVNRAMSQLGVRYSWAAGNYDGPTYGVNSPGTDGFADGSVYGFDCSGLTLYAWAIEGLYMAHYAATQYTQAGSYHPDSSNFMPGDLLFWSTGGIDGIHHVAMYIGNGNVIQAPNSGDVVKITPWDQVAYGYFGATRPLS